eukprot:TRINITY_DN10753_c0_g1_i1.p1 TRINITY_DN10753_c0_g1~~TRINITY_DN10753_c0_g1_i1.p1  ORF type:complete len:533 (-),score=66.17 TRINITY_DN10753_c0_g1_i1:35-1633(-)
MGVKPKRSISLQEFSEEQQFFPTKRKRMDSTTLNSTKRKNLAFIIIYGLFGTFLTVGIIFGWSALLIVLEREQVYANYCHPNQTDSNNLASSNESVELAHTFFTSLGSLFVPYDNFSDDSPSPSDVTCTSQSKRLNLIYTSALICNLVVSFLAGLLLDRYGPKPLMAVGSFLFGSGCVIFGLSHLLEFDGYIAGYALMGCACPCIFLSLLTIGQFVPQYVSTVMGLLNCSFDASAIVMTLFKLMTEHGIKLGLIFVSYSGLSLYLLSSLVFWPKVIPKEPSRGSLLNQYPDEAEEYDSLITPKAEEQPRSTFLSRLKLIKTFDFFAILIYFVIANLWLNMYIGTISVQLTSKFGKDESVRLTQLFNYILPGGILAVPVVGWLMDKRGLITSFVVLTTALTALSVVNIFSISDLHIANFVLFTFCRALFYSLAVTFVVKTFGFEAIGTLYGIIQVVGGASTYLQYVLLSVTLKQLHGNFFIVNVVQAGTIGALYFFPFYLWIKHRRMLRQTEIQDVTEVENEEEATDEDYDRR